MPKPHHMPIALIAVALATPAFAQGDAAAPAGPANEVVKQVIVYGKDPCPPSVGDEIVVCARLPDGDRYRIPKQLRTDPNNPQLESWTNRARSIEYVGRSGTNSCSPVGAGGFTGCFGQIAKAAKEERKALLGDASWADLVAAERAKRLGTIDADSEAIEAEAKEQEAARAAAAAKAAQGATAPVDDTPLPEPKPRP